MRISYLRRREPIDQIVEATLSRHWTARFGRAYSARWQKQQQAQATAAQPWLCNVWLNVIFPPNVNRAALEPILREFSRSTVAWRRPLQKLYVRLATRRPFARWLCHGTMNVSDTLPDQQDTIIVPGNNKLRVLVRNQQRCYGLLKDRFPNDKYLCELEARRKATDAGVCVPTLLERNDDEGWFSEQYVTGTPINRLCNTHQQQTAVAAAARSLSALVKSTSQTIRFADYVKRLVAEASARAESNWLVRGDLSTKLRSHITALQQRLTSADVELVTALTHGDFQPANVLVDADQVWIIDWEYARRRQAGFDALTFVTEARSPTGLANRLMQVSRQPSPQQTEVADALDAPGLAWHDAAQRTRALNLYMLEELCFHLQENDNPLFRRLNHGFETFVDELGHGCKHEQVR